MALHNLHPERQRKSPIEKGASILKALILIGIRVKKKDADQVMPCARGGEDQAIACLVSMAGLVVAQMSRIE
jgi:hypothetical protein